MLNQIVTFLAGFASGWLAYPVLAQWLPTRGQRAYIRRKWQAHAGRWPS